MKYKLKSGRIVEKGDYVSVRLTDKTIKFFEEMGMLEKITPTHNDVYMEDILKIFNIFKQKIWKYISL